MDFLICTGIFLPVKLYHGPQFQGRLNTVLALSLWTIHASHQCSQCAELRTQIRDLHSSWKKWSHRNFKKTCFLFIFFSDSCYHTCQCHPILNKPKDTHHNKRDQEVDRLAAQKYFVPLLAQEAHIPPLKIRRCINTRQHSQECLGCKVLNKEQI